MFSIHRLSWITDTSATLQWKSRWLKRFDAISGAILSACEHESVSQICRWLNLRNRVSTEFPVCAVYDSCLWFQNCFCWTVVVFFSRSMKDLRQANRHRSKVNEKEKKAYFRCNGAVDSIPLCDDLFCWWTSLLDRTRYVFKLCEIFVFNKLSSSLLSILNLNKHNIDNKMRFSFVFIHHFYV